MVHKSYETFIEKPTDGQGKRRRRKKQLVTKSDSHETYTRLSLSGTVPKNNIRHLVSECWNQKLCKQKLTVACIPEWSHCTLVANVTTVIQVMNSKQLQFMHKIDIL